MEIIVFIFRPSMQSSTKQLSRLKNQGIFSVVSLTWQKLSHMQPFFSQAKDFLKRIKLIFLAQTAFQVRKNFQISEADIYWVCSFFTRRWCLCPKKLSYYLVAVQVLTQCDCCFNINNNCKNSKDFFHLKFCNDFMKLHWGWIAWLSCSWVDN